MEIRIEEQSKQYTMENKKKRRRNESYEGKRTKFGFVNLSTSPSK
jgi:hypothetical protein